MSPRGQAPAHDSGTLPLAWDTSAEKPRLPTTLTAIESHAKCRLGWSASLLGRYVSLNSGEDVLFKAVIETAAGLHCELGHAFVSGSGRFQEKMGSWDGSRVSIPRKDGRSSCELRLQYPPAPFSEPRFLSPAICASLSEPRFRAYPGHLGESLATSGCKNFLDRRNLPGLPPKTWASQYPRSRCPC